MPPGKCLSDAQKGKAVCGKPICPRCRACQYQGCINRPTGSLQQTPPRACHALPLGRHATPWKDPVRNGCSMERAKFRTHDRPREYATWAWGGSQACAKCASLRSRPSWRARPCDTCVTMKVFAGRRQERCVSVVCCVAQTFSFASEFFVREKHRQTPPDPRTFTIETYGERLLYIYYGVQYENALRGMAWGLETYGENLGGASGPMDSASIQEFITRSKSCYAIALHCIEEDRSKVPN